MSFNFNYSLPVNLQFGRGEINSIGEHAAKYGTRPLLVIGKNSARKSGLFDRVLTLLRASRVEPVIFDDVSSNPLTSMVANGVAVARENNCDLLIGIGGGSILDAAKGIAFMACNDGEINDYILGKAPSGGALPIILAPTTCGTGSEGNTFAVFTNPNTMDKKSLKSSLLVPSVSIIDSTLMESLPTAVLASVGLDAFCHSMEAYLSSKAQPLVDVMVLEAMRLIADKLLTICSGTGTADDWDKLALASTIGGMAIHSAGITAGHAMEHPVSGLKDVAHGQGLAAITSAILRRTRGAATDRMTTISKILGGTEADDCADAFDRFADSIGMRYRLSDFGVTLQDVDWLTKNCLKVSAAGLSQHPVVFDEQTIRELYTEAL